MKKWIIKFFEWDRMPQAVSLIACITVLVFIRGRLTVLAAGAFGFILGFVYTWEFYIHIKRERDWWKDRAFNQFKERDKLIKIGKLFLNAKEN